VTGFAEYACSSIIARELRNGKAHQPFAAGYRLIASDTLGLHPELLPERLGQCHAPVSFALESVHQLTEESACVLPT
jgi:hypothetical protein